MLRKSNSQACPVAFWFSIVFMVGAGCSSASQAPPLFGSLGGSEFGADASGGSAAASPRTTSGGVNAARMSANAGHAPGSTACKSRSCADLGVSCGPIDDGCGHFIVCGTCPKDEVCDIHSGTCTSLVKACATSACGFVTDACNNSISCGTSCAAGSLCQGNQCVACPAVACDGRCGDVPDGCGGLVNCGDCPKGSVCDAIEFICETCTRKTCADLPTGTCGRQSDGCGGVLQCSCPAGISNLGACRAVDAECGNILDACITDLKHDCASGNGAMGCAEAEMCEMNKCLPCVPVTCADAHWTCGTFYDTCGNQRVCGDNGGACPAGQICANGSCESCTPKTCGSTDCGIISDGCGGTITCGKDNGECPAGQYCVSNVCTTCTPKLCTANCCGTMDSGCGYAIDYGACANAGEGCTANVCTPCTPKTCAELGKSCGKADDGCGHAIQCGACAAGQVCLSNNTCCLPLTCETFTGAGPDGCGGYLECQG